MRRTYYRIRRIIIDSFWEVVYAFQRMFKGYDNVDVFNLDMNMESRMIKLLTEFRKYHMGLFNCPKEYIELSRHDGAMSEEDTDTIIDMMIYHITWGNEDYVLEKLYGDKYRYNTEDYRRVNKIAEQNRECAFKLLRLFWKGLWY